LHEEVLIGSPSEVRATLGTARGELTFVISSLPAVESAASADPAAILAVARAAGLGIRTTSELLRAAGLPRREAYRAAASVPSGARPSKGRLTGR